MIPLAIELTFWGGLGYGITLLFLLFLISIFSGSEVAFFSLSLDQQNELRENENPRYRQIVRLLDEPKFLLATLLIAVNLANITFVTISSYLTIQLNDGENKWVYLALTIGVTFLIVFFGELIPKVYASQNNIVFLGYTTWFISILIVVFRPLSRALLAVSDLVEKRIKRKSYILTSEELSHAVDITTNENTSEKERSLLKGIVNFGNTTVRQVMRSRLEIMGMPASLSFHELVEKINESGYSRIPIYKETVDKIEGILYIKDLILHLNKKKEYSWHHLIRAPFFIPESKMVDDLLYDFKEKRVHMAIVVNEYGETEGLITLEDVIEEIMGEIRDEYDDDNEGFKKLQENIFEFEARTSINDLCKTLNYPPDFFDKGRGESESLAGLLIELFGRLPQTNEEITYDDKVLFTVLSSDERKINEVLVKRL